ncbi:Rgg family transcriptional regulator [Piscibacillus sp. B03]|uniref:Rgg family transcriptional regulator n=1 Tax=Piscibacillus sp. B03 TaxID=3457430 RepID=UPI003FCCEED9
MNENYGKTLREVRKHKGYTLQELAGGICSVSFLSKFERDESEISLSLFKQLLARLAVSFDEFFYIHNDQADDFEAFFDSVSECFIKNDLLTLKQMKEAEVAKWNETRSRTARCNKIAIDRIVDLIKYEPPSNSEEDLQFLYEYLFNVEVWGKYETHLYNLTMHLLPLDMVVTLSRTAVHKSERYRGIKNGASTIVGVLLNTLIYLTSIPNEQVHPYAEEFLEKLDQLGLDDRDLYEKVEKRVVRGYYNMKTGQISQGEKRIREVIAFYESVDSMDLAKKVETYLEFYLENIK